MGGLGMVSTFRAALLLFRRNRRLKSIQREWGSVFGYTAREKLSNLGMLLVGAVWLWLYANPVRDWWTDSRALRCPGVSKDGVIEAVLATWFTGCRWASDADHYAFPALLLVVGMYIVLFGSLIRDWRAGPPQWAGDLAAFGAATIISVGVAGAAFYVLGLQVVAPHEQSRVTIMTFLLGLLTWFVIPIGILFVLGPRSYAISRGMYESINGRGGLLTSTLGAVIGLAIASLVVLAVLGLLLVTAPVVLLFVLAFSGTAPILVRVVN